MSVGNVFHSLVMLNGIKYHTQENDHSSVKLVGKVFQRLATFKDINYTQEKDHSNVKLAADVFLTLVPFLNINKYMTLLRCHINATYVMNCLLT